MPFSNSRCLLDLGYIYQTRNDVPEAMRWFRAASESQASESWVRDAINAAWQSVKSEVEGSDAFSHRVISDDNEELASARNFLEAAEGVFPSAKAMQAPPLAALEACIETGLRYGEDLQREPAPPERIFTHYAKLFKMLISAERFDKTTVWLNEVSLVAEAYLKFGEPYQQIQYLLARESRTLLSHANAVERIVFLLELFARIKALPKSDHRLAALEDFLVLLGERRHVVSELSQRISTAELCEVAANAFEEERLRPLTAEAGAALRKVWDRMLQILNLFVFTNILSDDSQGNISGSRTFFPSAQGEVAVRLPTHKCQKQKRSPKKKPPKKIFSKKHKHVSTARVIAGRLPESL